MESWNLVVMDTNNMLAGHKNSTIEGEEDEGMPNTLLARYSALCIANSNVTLYKVLANIERAAFFLRYLMDVCSSLIQMLEVDKMMHPGSSGFPRNDASIGRGTAMIRFDYMIVCRHDAFQQT